MSRTRSLAGARRDTASAQPSATCGGAQTGWARIPGAIPVDGRFSGMLFGHKDDAADDPGMTCPTRGNIDGYLEGFELELWREREEDGQTALGDEHHLQLVKVVAVRRELPHDEYVG